MAHHSTRPQPLAAGTPAAARLLPSALPRPTGGASARDIARRPGRPGSPVTKHTQREYAAWGCTTASPDRKYYDIISTSNL
ncbi:MAG: hypothetical protein EF813_02195 [Methanosarcinales archaeon]|nr:MAG: hypothetical protein EF813_02195 [Methanosarcinales archaeon]